MLLPEKTIITVETGINTPTSIYGKRYTLIVADKNDKQAIITLKADYINPNGSVSGNKRKLLLESELLDIPQGITVKQWIAQLVIVTDNDIRDVNTLSKSRNKSAQTIHDKLKQISE